MSETTQTLAGDLPLDAPPSPSPPTRQAFKSLWVKFRSNVSSKKDPSTFAPLSPSASNTNSDALSYDSSGLPAPKLQDDFQDPNVFGQSLESTLQVRVMTVERMNSGRLVKYGPLPMIVAICGFFLEQNALHVQGIFRVSGSVKRVREIQRIFATGPDFGYNIDWTGYTVHDAASLLRRYLNSLPEPIIPLRFYDDFRSPFIHPLTQTKQFKKHEMNEVIVKLHGLIQQLPPANRQLLLYILDLLQLFAKNSKKNMMPAANLAAIFQPCILSHPSHHALPEEYTTSQEAVIFMIEHFKVFRNMADLDNTHPDDGDVIKYEEKPRNSLLNTARRAISSGSNIALLRDLDSKGKNCKNFQRHVQEQQHFEQHTGMRKTLRRSNTVPVKRTFSTPLVGANLDTAKRAADAAPSKVSQWAARRSQSNRNSIVMDEAAIAGAAAAYGVSRSRSGRISGIVTPSRMPTSLSSPAFATNAGSETHSIQHTPEPFQRPFDSVEDYGLELVIVPKRGSVARRSYNRGSHDSQMRQSHTSLPPVEPQPFDTAAGRPHPYLSQSKLSGPVVGSSAVPTDSQSHSIVLSSSPPDTPLEVLNPQPSPAKLPKTTDVASAPTSPLRRRVSVKKVLNNMVSRVTGQSGYTPVATISNTVHTVSRKPVNRQDPRPVHHKKKLQRKAPPASRARHDANRFPLPPSSSHPEDTVPPDALGDSATESPASSLYRLSHQSLSSPNAHGVNPPGRYSVDGSYLNANPALGSGGLQISDATNSPSYDPRARNGAHHMKHTLRNHHGGTSSRGTVEEETIDENAAKSGRWSWMKR
ncbi:uncharacterized protein V1513DRAFT_430703 [Lipomyces chichibuensis]|uniref:uncharacterized protein n=1 Tax=Lipomyces chichibuensis TaxID=1546026 RepID=UPI003343B763